MTPRGYWLLPGRLPSHPQKLGKAPHLHSLFQRKYEQGLKDLLFDGRSLSSQHLAYSRVGRILAPHLRGSQTRISEMSICALATVDRSIPKASVIAGWPAPRRSPGSAIRWRTTASAGARISAAKVREACLGRAEPAAVPVDRGGLSQVEGDEEVSRLHAVPLPYLHGKDPPGHLPVIIHVRWPTGAGRGAEPVTPGAPPAEGAP